MRVKVEWFQISFSLHHFISRLSFLSFCIYMGPDIDNMKNSYWAPLSSVWPQPLPIKRNSGFSEKTLSCTHIFKPVKKSFNINLET